MKNYQTESLNWDLYTQKGQMSYCLYLRMDNKTWDFNQTKKKNRFKKLKLKVLKLWRQLNGRFEFNFARKKLNSL